MELFRGALIRYSNNGKNLELLRDSVIAVDQGKIVLAEPFSAFAHHPQVIGAEVQGQIVKHRGQEIPPQQFSILPPTTNLHDHSFQPPGIPGELIVFDEKLKKLVGWLPTTLREGEFRAKQNKDAARRMIRTKLRAFALNGIGTVLQYATSSVEATETVLEEAESLGMRVIAGYVCMDQGIDDIQKGLQTSGEEAAESTEYLLKKYGPQRVCVIDRFPIAVSSATREKIVVLARKYGALYETHMDESTNEKKIHSGIYGTPSIATTLLQDGVFEPGLRAGLAHAIHTTPDEMAKIESKIRGGSSVSIRACPNSNAHLGSHWDGDRYVEFPFGAWQQHGALVTFGTDQGAGRGWNMFAEMLDEKRRHPINRQPSHAELLKCGTLTGLLSVGIDPRTTNIVSGNQAEFVVVQMAGAEGFYEPNTHDEDLETVAARILEGGQCAENILTMYVAGKCLKSMKKA